MKYKRDRLGYLCYTDNQGKITSRVPDDKPDTNKFMFGVDTEFDDAWEDEEDGPTPWTE